MSLHCTGKKLVKRGGHQGNSSAPHATRLPFGTTVAMHTVGVTNRKFQYSGGKKAEKHFAHLLLCSRHTFKEDPKAYVHQYRREEQERIFRHAEQVWSLFDLSSVFGIALSD